MKKLLTLLALLSLGLSYSAAFADVAPEPDPFTDVRESDEDYVLVSAVIYLKAQGIITGYSDGSFRPDNLINRAEFAKLVSIASSGDVNMAGDGGNIFIDIDTSAWYNPYIQELYLRGVISGYSDHSFKPENNINFAEAAKMVSTAYAMYATGDVAVANPWYEPYIEVLVNVDAQPDSVTSPDQLITRGEMAKIMYYVGLDQN
jgi:hypothetical protein